MNGPLGTATVARDAHTVITPGDPASPVVLHVPHASRHIPDELRGQFQLTDAELVNEHDESADTGTDVIAEAAWRATTRYRRPWVAVNTLSRLVVDPERFPDETEAMNAKGRGAVYTQTCRRTPLRTDNAEPTASVIRRLFEPYAKGIDRLVTERLSATGAAVVLDVHSYPTEPSWFETAGLRRPPVCLGTDSFHTPAWLRDAAEAAFSEFGGIAENEPYAGCYVPLNRYRTDPRVLGIMLEVRRDVYLDAQYRPIPERVEALGQTFGALVDTVSEHVRD